MHSTTLHTARLRLDNPIEIGWRLHPDFWRQGLATEAAHRMAGFAFDRFPIEELLAVRRPDNLASGRVTERLGMRQRGLEPWYGTTVATHVIARGEWQKRQALPADAAPGLP